MKIRPNKMISYLAVTAGVGCVSSVANAAVVFYGPTATPPNGISISSPGSYVRLLTLGSARMGGTSRYEAPDINFTRGNNVALDSGPASGLYYSVDGRFNYGAILGVNNYANISFNGHDSVYEAVGQFYFDGAGGGYLIAIATTNPIPNPQNLSAVGGPALSISAGKAMIAAVPEPSGLVLLALGATGLAARRQRKKAA